MSNSREKGLDIFQDVYGEAAVNGLTKMGLANGLSRIEIEEVLYSAVPYCGLPAANVAKAAMKQAFAEFDSGV